MNDCTPLNEHIRSVNIKTYLQPPPFKWRALHSFLRSVVVVAQLILSSGHRRRLRRPPRLTRRL